MCTDDCIGFAIESLDEHIVTQIEACALVLRSLFDACADKRCAQMSVLKGVVNLVTGPKHGATTLSKTAEILKTLCAEAPAPAHMRTPHAPSRRLGVY